MFLAFDPGAKVPAADLVEVELALAALTLRCARIEYSGSKGYVHQRDVYWVPLAVRPRDGSSWLLWEKVPPVYPDTSGVLPVRGLSSSAVSIDREVYRAERFNYLDVPNVETLRPGGWMASQGAGRVQPHLTQLTRCNSDAVCMRAIGVCTTFAAASGAGAGAFSKRRGGRRGARGAGLSSVIP